MTSTWASGKMVIGIDFGDEYSSVAYGYTMDYYREGLAGINVITSWPGMLNRNAANRFFKTAVAYAEDGQTVVAWGHQVRPQYKGTVYSNLKSRIAMESVSAGAALQPEDKNSGTSLRPDKSRLLDDRALLNITELVTSISWEEPDMLNIKKHASTCGGSDQDSESRGPDSDSNELSSRRDMLNSLRALLQDGKLLKSSKQAGRILELLKSQTPAVLEDTSATGLDLLKPTASDSSTNHLKIRPLYSVEKDSGAPSGNLKVSPAKPVLDIVTDLFREVQKAIWDECARLWGRELFAMMNKDLVITAPADWQQETKDRFFAAMGRAFQPEISSIRVVTSEEAAALFVMKANQEKVASTISGGDVYLLVDCREDFFVAARSYHVTQSSPVIAVEQMGPVSSDQRLPGQPRKDFLRWLRDWVGQERYDRIPESKLGPGCPLLVQLETCLANFFGEDGDSGEIRLPLELGIEDDDDLCIEDGYLELSGQRIKGILQPYLDRVLDLIQHQVKASLVKPKGIILTGHGADMMPYLGERIKEYCQSLGVSPLNRPFLGYRCADRGAVLCGLEAGERNLVRVRLSRRHLGIVLPGTGGEIEWFIAKGEQIRKSLLLRRATMTKRFVGSTNLTEVFEEKYEGLTLVSSQQDGMPGGLADPDVQVVARVRMVDLPLQKINPRKEFSSVCVDDQGRHVYEMAFEIQADFTETISFTILHRGEALGQTSLEFD